MTWTPKRYRVAPGVIALAYTIRQLPNPMLAWRLGAGRTPGTVRCRVRWLPSAIETERDVPESLLSIWQPSHEESWDQAMARAVARRV